jgi:hypothetical protein
MATQTAQIQTPEDTTLSFEIRESSFSQSYIEETLTEFEVKYGMTSEEFYHLWLKGEGPDTKDTSLWGMLYEIKMERAAQDNPNTTERSADMPDQNLEHQAATESPPPPFEIVEIKLTVEYLENQIAEYEAKYGLTSEEFYQMWLKGEGPDTKDTGGWAVMYEILQKKDCYDLE